MSSLAFCFSLADRLLDWIRIATEIELNYTLFDAFVVLHGTDTMTYTSSALTFMLEDLGKTVVCNNIIPEYIKLDRNSSDRLLLVPRFPYRS